MKTILRDATLRAQDYFDSDEILLFIGPRQAGKTTILKQLQEYTETHRREPQFFLNLEDPDYRALLNQSPKNIFRIFPIDRQRRSVLFIDEVQYLHDPSNALKYLYDEYKGQIKLCVSGSSAFYLDQKFHDSLAGRKRILYVHTLSFGEFLRFQGREELWKRRAELTLSQREDIERFLEEYILYGGYPRVVLAPREEKKELLRELAYSYIKKDAYEGKVRHEDIFYRLMKILAAQIGQLVNASELASTLGISKTAVNAYLWVMQKSFHIMMISPFFKNVRKELTKMPKVFFLDLGLRNFFLDNFQPFAVRDDRGALLENAVLRQLLEKHDHFEIHFWRTTQKHELDFIVGQEALEVKMKPDRAALRSMKVFRAQYPNMQLKFVTFSADTPESGDIPVQEVWQI